jgi:hypothetical protein
MARMEWNRMPIGRDRGFRPKDGCGRVDVEKSLVGGQDYFLGVGDESQSGTLEQSMQSRGHLYCIHASI